MCTNRDLQANFKDSLETVVVTEKVVRGWLQSRKQTVVYLEASMKNCYGLIGVKTFLNLPFLKMQVNYSQQKNPGVFPHL